MAGTGPTTALCCSGSGYSTAASAAAAACACSPISFATSSPSFWQDRENVYYIWNCLVTTSTVVAFVDTGDQRLPPSFVLLLLLEDTRKQQLSHPLGNAAFRGQGFSTRARTKGFGCAETPEGPRLLLHLNEVYRSRNSRQHEQQVEAAAAEENAAPNWCCFPTGECA